VHCATNVFVLFTALTSVLVCWGFKNLYRLYEEGKLNIFKKEETK
jgi:hypothetical protein